MSTDDSIKKPLKSYREDFESITKNLSDIFRNLSFAGIGIIWIFKNNSLNSKIIPDALYSPLVLLIIALALDFMQYLWKGINYYAFYKRNEILYDKKKLTEKDIEDVQIWNYVSIGTWTFFGLKIGFMIAAFINIFCFIQSRM